MGLLPAVGIPSPALPQNVPFVTHKNHANPKIKKLNQSTSETTVSWTSRITLLSRNGRLAEAAREFSGMRLAGVEPNHITFIALLSGCSDFPSLGDLLHGYACKLGLDKTHVMVGTAIIGMYSKRGRFRKARLVFDYMEDKNSVTWNTMIDGYMRSGQVDTAVKMFDEMPNRDLISWTAMINGFVKKGFHEEALAWFREMQISGVKPDYVAIIAALAACTNLGALSFGLWVHRYVMSQDFKNNVRVSNTLIDLYCRCGCVEFAREVFDKMEKRTVVSWNSVVVGFAANGNANESLVYFRKMQEEGFKPDAVTFTGALTACSHVGLVEEGLRCFQTMKRDYRISPRIEHYGCLVDLYSRAGRLEDALNVVQSMPMKPNEVVIGSLLAACRNHGNNTVLAERLVKHLTDLNVKSHSNYVILSNMYAADGKWEGASKMRRKMKGLGLKKQPGFSSIEIDDYMHVFMAGDSAHVETAYIREVLELISSDSRLQGCVFETLAGDLLNN
ncbi:Pentatricopeptide repeat-containing protein [Cardamine amara subsp. amara]|uniref:Pentatricopeptide repeat-containing protein n=1 Tax=Cardamine amara subsp. amara TaxID=228776 RepID=A0ABD1C0W2_CARAN